MKSFDSILDRFNKEMERRMVRVHGVTLIQSEKVIAESYRYPYTADTNTRMYSTSKSIAAVAIGKLVGEGKLSLDDKIVNIFADRFDMSEVHPWLKEQTVRHMLCMSTVYSKPTYSEKVDNWLESYFYSNPSHPCGTLWFYDSSGSYVLGAVTKHITGMDFIEYLRPEFDIMGVSKDIKCFNGPDGEAWASSAVLATTSDLGKIAYLLLNKGRWNGKQLIPEDYAIDAISPLVRNDDGAKVSRFDCGYGYQVWGHADGAFAFRGLGGQVAIGFPGRDLVFSINSDASRNTNAYDDIFHTVESVILPEFPIIDREEYEKAQPKPVTENVFEEIKGVNYILEKNYMKIDSVRVEGDGENCKLFYTRGEKEYCLDFTVGRESETVFPQKYTGEKLFDPEYYMNYKCSVIGEWIEPRKLRIRVFAEDIYVGNMAICLGFRADGKIGVKAQKNAQFFFDDFNGFAGGEAERK